MSVKIEVWGDYACFSRPEMKVERVSYDIITPSAARGILEAIYWHPGLVWRIDRIWVCKPIQFTNIRRNEVKDKISASNIRTVMNHGKGELCLVTSQSIQQRAAMILRDVRYVIEAHFDMTTRATAADNPGKFKDIVKRRAQKGQFYHQPYFGTREFPANFKLCESVPECPAELLGKHDLGWMLLDMDYSDRENIKPMFFRGILKDGILEVPPIGSKEVAR